MRKPYYFLMIYQSTTLYFTIAVTVKEDESTPVQDETKIDSLEPLETGITLTNFSTIKNSLNNTEILHI